MRQQLDQEIERLAQDYIDKSPNELQRLFLQEWNKIQTTGKTPVRGEAKDFWIGVKDKLVAKAVKNPAIVSATVSTVAGQVLTWAQGAGIDLTLYKIAISILVAWVTQSVLEQLKASQKPKGK